ncbi:DUF389 domain-containing protein [Massilia sp. BKSP1R2A-1]|jgi:uncharacterized hydrophobic protein (TIGR00271 family)|uniref:DUF389 domain-containing protein n=1 Tax=Massilia sp. BKSP1R2A-1 TaxID=3422595 RepID=UPI003D326EBB
MSEFDKTFAPQSEAPMTLAQRFSLLHDKADDDVIDASLRSGVELRGATPWILMFAILVASIGLNINSPAVIIGAMLISPLMGPITGIGYGIGIYDFALIRRSLLNLGIAAAISLVTSTLYFLLTPLDEAQSELLARTTPTLWDVLIALTGGLAGIIGMTRREKSNVIPGVAIATALMPPLCTAGYGLANGQWAVFGGAFYLFSINCVFIAVSTVIVIEFLRLPHRKFVDVGVERRVKRTLWTVVLLTALPSIYLAIQLVDNEVFGHRARQFVRNEFGNAGTHVVDVQLDPLVRQVELTLIGPRMPLAAIQAIEKRLPQSGLPGARLLVHQAEDSRVDVGVLKADILADIYRDTQQGLRERDATIAQLRQELAKRDARRDAWRETAFDIRNEFVAQYPNCEVLMGVALVRTEDGKPAVEAPMLTATCKRALTTADAQRARTWLTTRTKSDGAQLVLIPAPRRR